MSEPAFFLVRHGATEWSQNGRHTSYTDLPLLPQGRERARELRRVFAGRSFARVLCSPLRRARETCELAGFGDQMEICEDLTEWNYGEYEGLTTAEIHEQKNPDWNLWRDGCPGGESPSDVAARVDRAIELAVGGRSGAADAPADAGAHAPTDTIAFAHGHVLRVLGARWMDLGAGRGERLLLDTATISKLGHEHTYRVIERWNAATL
jgi:broad specificity phosphatase PhoE